MVPLPPRDMTVKRREPRTNERTTVTPLRMRQNHVRRSRQVGVCGFYMQTSVMTLRAMTLLTPYGNTKRSSGVRDRRRWRWRQRWRCWRRRRPRPKQQYAQTAATMSDGERFGGRLVTATADRGGGVFKAPVRS